MTDKIKILIIGNGFGGVYTLKHLHKIFHDDPKVELALIGNKNNFLFTPLLHEVATGGINPENIIEPIRNIIGCCLKNFYLGTANFIDLNTKTVISGENIIPYDYLVLSPGSTTNFYGIKGAEEYSLTLKSTEDAIKIKNQSITMMEKASHEKDEILRKKMLKFIIIGGGPTGVELAGELQEFIKENLPNQYGKKLTKDASIIIINRGDELINQFHHKLRKKSLKYLHKKGIKVLLNTAVKEVTQDSVILENGEKIEGDNIIWVAGTKPRELKFNQELEKFTDGRLLTNKYLQIKNHSNIFALGDIATLVNDNYPKGLPALAQVAEKQAKIVAENIYLSVNNKKLKEFNYHHSGDLLSLGKFMAIGEISNFTFSGVFAWWLWRTVYLSKLLSWRKKLEVALDWTINLFTSRDTSKV
jgi:NADH:ubiquinone reductase (H+-translocating)